MKNEKESKKTKLKTSPVRLQSKIKHAYKASFLYYVNEIVTEIAEELKILTSACEKLFGKFPIPDDKSNFWRDSVFIYEPSDGSQYTLWNKISKVFRECIWKETRNSFGGFDWFPILKENDSELKIIMDFEDEIKQKSFQYVESLSDEKLNELRTIFASRYAKPKESLDILELQLSYWSNKSQKLNKSESYNKLQEIKDSKLKLLIEFQTEFDSIIKKFCLEKEWVAESVFRAIWDGTGKLRMDGYYRESIPESVNIQIENNLNIPNNEFLFRETDFPSPNPFTYQEPYNIHDPFIDYENDAINAYRQHLHAYFKVIKDSLLQNGYKNTRGDGYDYKLIKNLVYWNISSYKHLWEVLQDIPELADININNTDQRNSEEDKLRKLLISVEKFDLPIRPYGKKRTKKTGIDSA